MGTRVCRELCDGYGHDLELKKAAEQGKASLGVSIRVMILAVHCILPTKQILASYGCFVLDCFTTGFVPCTGNISISK